MKLMKHAIILSGVAIMGLTPVLASAADKVGPYVSFSGHAVFTEDSNDIVAGVPIDSEFDTGFGIGTALGYDFAGAPVRLEGEMVYRNNEVTVSSPAVPGFAPSDTVDSIAYMANAYYDIETNSNITPYVGAGAGVVDIDGEDTVFAYQAMAGAAVGLNENSELYGGYRYFGSEGLDVGGATLDYASHSAEVGYRLRF